MVRGVVLLTLIGATNVAAAAAAPAADVRKDFDAAQVKRIELENAFGEVRVTATDALTATVIAHKIHVDEGCVLQIALTGTTLTIVNKEPARQPDRTCQVNFDVQVPRHLEMLVTVGAGDVTVTGMKGSLDYRLGSGNLTLTKVDFGELSGRSGSGDVAVAADSLADADLKLGAGHATIAVSHVPARGHLDLKLGTGSTEIRLPHDAKVHASYRAGMGTLTNEFTDVPGAAFTISGSAGAGNMTIKSL